MHKKLMVLILVSGIPLCHAMEQNHELKVGVFSTINQKRSQEDRFYHGAIEGGNLYAVYDGHGKYNGHEIAQFLVKALPDYFKETDAKSSIEDRMKAAFKIIDNHDCVKTSTHCGSTASVVFVKDNSAYFAHVGDSRVVLLGEKGKVCFATEDHNAKNANEYMRVLDEGGYWHEGRVQGKLAVSRAFGDRDIDKEKKIISAEPECAKKLLTEENKFLVLGTDGLWDKVTNDEVAELLTQHYVNCKDLNQLAEKLVLVAIGRKSRDNITVMVVDLLSIAKVEKY